MEEDSSRTSREEVRDVQSPAKSTVTSMSLFGPRCLSPSSRASAPRTTPSLEARSAAAHFLRLLRSPDLRLSRIRGTSASPTQEHSAPWPLPWDSTARPRVAGAAASSARRAELTFSSQANQGQFPCAAVKNAASYRSWCPEWLQAAATGGNLRGRSRLRGRRGAKSAEISTGWTDLAAHGTRGKQDTCFATWDQLQ